MSRGASRADPGRRGAPTAACGQAPVSVRTRLRGEKWSRNYTYSPAGTSHIAMRMIFMVSLCFLTLAGRAAPQLAPVPAFEVASVKYNDRTAGSWCRFLPGGRLSASSWVKQLIQIAWGVEDYQVSGGPGWLTTDWYAIEAKAPDAAAGQPEMLLMLQSLLVDRFQLELRRATKDLNVYELKVDRNGPKLRPLKDGEASQCARDNSFVCGIRTPAQLARSLQHLVDRPVIDKTGLDGRFDILLDFDVYSSRGQTPPPGFDKPSVFKALQDQLGLRLEPQKASFSELTVESIRRPTEN